MRQIFPIVGAAVGSFFGSPQLGFAIGSIVGNVVDPQVIKGPSIGDGQTQTSNEGVARPIIFGTASCAGNIIAQSKTRKIKKKKSQGKGTPVVETEELHKDFAIRICEGPVSAVLRIWENETLKYDVRAEGSQVSTKENEKFLKNFTLHLGGEVQEPDSTLETIFGVGNTPAYINTCYIVFKNYNLTNFGGAIPNYRFEVSVSDTKSTAPIYFCNAYLNGEYGELTAQKFIDYSNFNNRDCVITRNKKYIICSYQNGQTLFYKLNTTTLQYNLLQTLSFGGYCIPILTSKSDEYVYLLKIVDYTTTNNFLRCYKITDSGLVLNSELTNLKVFNYAYSIPVYIHCLNKKEDTILYCNAGIGYNFTKIKIDAENGLILNKEEIAVPAPLQNRYTFPNFIGESNNIISIFYSGKFYTYNLNTNTIITSKDFGSLQLTTNIIKNLLIYNDKYWDEYIIFDNNSTNCRFKINKDGSTITDLESNYIPKNDLQNYSGFTNRACDLNGDYIIFGGTNGNPNLNCFYLYKRNSAGYYDVIQTKTTTQIKNEIGINNSFNNNGLCLFVGTVNYTQITGQFTFNNCIQSLSKRIGFTSDNFNLTQTKNINIRGLVLASDYTMKDVLQTLQNSFFYDVSEYDQKINLVLKGGEIKRTFEYSEFVEDFYETNRKSAIEYPKKLNLTYQNATVGYDTAIASVSRSSINYQISGETSFSVPVVFSEDEAIQVAEKQLKIAWAEASGEYNFKISTENDDLVASDCIAVIQNQKPVRYRIEKIDRADGVLSLTCKIDRQSAYTSNLTGIPLSPPPDPPATITGQTEFAYLNLPALVDQNDILGYYYCVSGKTDAWYGAEVERKHNGIDEDYITIDSTINYTTFGILQQNLEMSSPHYSDTTNKIVVKVFDDNGSFESVSQENLLRENNGIVIQNSDGTGEIIQYRDATNLGNNTYELSYLLRGRLNTTSSQHLTGAKVCLLSDVRIVEVSSAEIGSTFLHRATSYGESPEDSLEYVSPFITPIIQTEFPVDLLNITNSGSNLNITFSPRERFGNDINPVRSSNWLTYEIKVSNGTNIETYTTTNPFLNVNTSLSGNLTITVYQKNRFTGNGLGVSALITV